MNYPPLWRRFAAIGYDFLLLLGVSVGYTLVYLMIAKAIGVDIEQPRTADFYVGLFLMFMGFFCFFWLREGQTLGMKVWRLKVVGAGQPLKLKHCIVRLILAPLSLAAAGIGYWWSLFDGNKQTLHDKLSGTQTILLDKTT